MHIPIPENELPDKVKELRLRLEALTGVEVYLGEDVFEHGKYVSFLCAPLTKNAEYFIDPEKRELVYILDKPLTGNMPESQYSQYPEIVQREIRRDFSDDLELRLSDNWLYSTCEDTKLEAMLAEMLEYVKLLQMGWHLGREKDFHEPYIEFKRPEEDFDDPYIEAEEE